MIFLFLNQTVYMLVQKEAEQPQCQRDLGLLSTHNLPV